MIQSIVKSVVDVMDSGNHSYSFGHTQKTIQNLQADEADLPIVFLDMPVVFDPDFTDTGFIKNVFKCQIVILFKSNMDDSGGVNNSPETIAEQEQIAIFEKAFAAQRQFMLLLNKSVDVKDFSYSGNAFQLQHVYDCDLSGIAFSVDIEPKDYAGVCTDGLFPVPNCPASPYVIEDEDGTILYNGTLQAGQSLNVIVQDSIVSNSNDSFSVNVLSEQDLELGDNTSIAVNSNMDIIAGGNFPAQEDATLNLPDVDNVDSDGSIVPTPSGVPFACTPVTPCVDFVGAELLKTGQTTSYISGDDGDLQQGRNGDFFTLPLGKTNPNGNNFRFTDEFFNYTDGSVYFLADGTPSNSANTFVKKIMIDWNQYDAVSETVRGYAFTDVLTNTRNFDDNISFCQSLSIPPFTSGWNACNDMQLFVLRNASTTYSLFYPPFSQYGIFQINAWSNTTNPLISNYASALIANRHSIERTLKTRLLRSIAQRIFNVSGTTLT